MRVPVVLVFVLATGVFGACARENDSKEDQRLTALIQKVRDKQETTKVGTDIAQRLGLRQEEEIPAHGHLVTDGKEHHIIMVTDANDIIIAFGSSSVAYFCLSDLSGKLRRVFMAEPGQPETDVAVAEVQWRFDGEIAFWKEYFGLPD
jgi:hypothetical protein